MLKAFYFLAWLVKPVEHTYHQRPDMLDECFPDLLDLFVRSIWGKCLFIYFIVYFLICLFIKGEMYINEHLTCKYAGL